MINKSKKVIFIGRSIDYYLGLEASLKLKEITYIPSECYQAGELKHGPISLIDDKTLVFILNTNESTLSKTSSNAQEVKSRNGIIYLVSTENIADFIVDDSTHIADVLPEEYVVGRYVDTGLKTHTEYFYRVCAVNTDGVCGELSNVFSAITKEPI